MNPHDQRLLLLRTGYDPIPCNGKRPVMDDWTARDKTNPTEIGMWSSPAGYPYAQNTGIRTRFTRDRHQHHGPVVLLGDDGLLFYSTDAVLAFAQLAGGEYHA